MNNIKRKGNRLMYCIHAAIEITDVCQKAIEESTLLFSDIEEIIEKNARLMANEWIERANDDLTWDEIIEPWFGRTANQIRKR